MAAGWRLAAGGGLPTPITAPPAPNEMRLWLRGDAGLTIGGGLADWLDQSPNGADVHAGPGGAAPPVFGATLDGVPSIDCTAGWMEGAVNLFASGEPRTIFSVCRPHSATGGTLMAFRRTFQSYSLLLLGQTGQTWAYSSNFVGSGGTDIRQVAPTDYSSAPAVFVAHIQDAALALALQVNGVPIALQAPTVVTAESGATGFFVGASSLFPVSFAGDIHEINAWPRVLSATEMAHELSYLSGRFPSA